MERKRNVRCQRDSVADSSETILRDSPLGKEVTYPSKHELKAMSQKIIDYHPMLQDTGTNMPYVRFLSFKIVFVYVCVFMHMRTIEDQQLISFYFTTVDHLHQNVLATPKYEVSKEDVIIV